MQILYIYIYIYIYIYPGLTVPYRDASVQRFPCFAVRRNGLIIMVGCRNISRVTSSGNPCRRGLNQGTGDGEVGQRESMRMFMEDTVV